MSLIERIAILVLWSAMLLVTGLGFGYKWAASDHKEAKVITKTVTETVEKVVPVLDNAALSQAKAEASAAKAEASGLKSMLSMEKANHATTKLLASSQASLGTPGVLACPADPVISDGLRTAINASLGAASR
ncbi:hypothetical protein HNP33_003070 [Comamonas odontotermitis]|uniref:Uncharacterized protein n=1 Tax=Comamonas odontotermitis TaxID=379895 RepID=A0ABR6RIG3_9BURK|nr:hypothetical protein [Comamonas odontotermitis]MBB6578965.1 hypothetical protein [Comamonas odontotermitis]